MALWRKVSMEIWGDSWVEDLEPLDKLLFLYLLTNQLTSPSGLYTISLRRVAYDTRLDIKAIEDILARFEDAEQVFYDPATKLMWIRMLREFNERGSDRVRVVVQRDIQRARVASENPVHGPLRGPRQSIPTATW